MKTLLTYIALLCMPMAAYAQTGLFIPQFSEEDAEYFKKRVMDAGEFMKRFNLEISEDPQMLTVIPTALPERKRVKREVLLKLLNREAYYKSPLSEQQQTEAFVDHISEYPDSISLGLYDSLWFAKLDVRVMYKGKSYGIKLTLKLEAIPQSTGYRWSLCGASAPFIDKKTSSPKTSFIDTPIRKGMSIPPDSYGRNFIEVVEVLNNSRQFIGMQLSDDIRQRGLNTKSDLYRILLAFQEGSLEVRHVKHTAFHLLQIPGWSLVLEETVENGEGYSGWVISKVKSVASYKQYMYKYLNISGI